MTDVPALQIEYNTPVVKKITVQCLVNPKDRMEVMQEDYTVSDDQAPGYRPGLAIRCFSTAFRQPTTMADVVISFETAAELVEAIQKMLPKK